MVPCALCRVKNGMCDLAHFGADSNSARDSIKLLRIYLNQGDSRTLTLLMGLHGGKLNLPNPVITAAVGWRQKPCI